MAERGRNIFEFTVARGELQSALDKVREQAGGKCLVNTTEVGPNVKISVILYSDLPEGEAEAIMNSLLDSMAGLHSFAAGKAEKEVDF